MMNADSIHSRVLAIAERFGAGNPQEFKLLVRQLSVLPSHEVAAGLLKVFQRSEPLQANYIKQELAGRLLAKLCPRANLDLDESLRSVLPAYNLSIEQLPQYLSAIKGRDAVLDALRLLQAELGECRESVAAKTMRWWLKDESLER